MRTRTTVVAVSTACLVALASVLIVVAMVATPAAQQAGASLTITVSPDENYVSGPVVLAARVDPPSTAVTSVSFFVDGRLVCTVERPPFDCPWNAGPPPVKELRISAQAMLANGKRLSANLWTKKLEWALNEDVDAIQLAVVVKDDHGNFIQGLPREAFRVFEDDVPQKITVFLSRDIPLELTAAIDMSGSMIDAVPQLKQSVRRFLSSLRPQNQVSLLGFNDNVFTLARASVDPVLRIKAVDRLSAWGGTALYDVIVKSVDMFVLPVGVHALVVFSDGEDTASHIKLETAEKRLQTSNATVYTIAQGRATKMAHLRSILDRIARTSGGRLFATEDIDRLSQAFDGILEELTNQYLVVYSPPVAKRDGKWHRIRVQVSPGQYTVRHREGYLGAQPKR